MSDPERPLEPLEEIARLLALQIRLALPNERQSVLELHRAGFGPERISQLLGTRPSTIKTTLRQSHRPMAADESWF